jgi:hypothetical protein
MQARVVWLPAISVSAGSDRSAVLPGHGGFELLGADAA